MKQLNDEEDTNEGDNPIVKNLISPKEKLNFDKIMANLHHNYISSSVFYLPNDNEKHVEYLLQPPKCLLNFYNKGIEENILDSFIAEQIKENEILISSIQKKLDNFLLNEQYNQSPIGPMSNLEKMGFLSVIPHLRNNVHEIFKYIKSWRMILGDGNCFYRVFLFAVIELHILNQNFKEIANIIYDIHYCDLDIKFSKKNYKAHKEEIISTLLIIYSSLKYTENLNENRKKAYNYFIKAYYKCESFDLGIIKYMRIALYKYINANKGNYYSNENKIDIGNLLPEIYINSDSTYKYKEFFENFLLCMDSEAEKIIIYLSPIVFNVNLDLYILNGISPYKIEKDKINFHKENFQCLPGEDKIKYFNTISLFYRFSHYEKLYTKDFLDQYEYNKNGSQNITFKQLKDYKCENEENKQIYCDKCKSDSEIISFYHIENFSICKMCCIKLIDEEFEKRLKDFFIQENNEIINHIEFYCRPVVINSGNKNYTLFDEDIIDLFSITTVQKFYNAVENSCTMCCKIKQNTYKLKCKCKICKDCFFDNLNKLTNGKFVLNKYEKREFLKSKKVTICDCLYNVDLEDLIKLSINKAEIDIYRENANERFNILVKSSCLNCKIQIYDAFGNIITDDEENFEKIYELPIIAEENDLAKVKHNLCLGCVDAVRLDISHKIFESKISKILPIKCAFCVKSHNIEYKYLKDILKRDSCCCSIQ